MSDPILSTFRFDRMPFAKGLDTDDLWLDDTRSRAVAALVSACETKEHALVLGEPGVGKTTVLRALRDRLSPVHFSCHYLAFVTLSPRDFIRQLCLALDLEAKATIAALFNALQAEIAHRHREHRVHPVVVTAELFAPDALGMLHDLTGGVLRSIDVLATEALRIAAVQDVKIVDRALLVRAHRASPLS